MNKMTLEQTTAMTIDFQTDPSRYRHWRVEYEGPVARLIMDVDPDAPLFEGYQLKLNSYDLGVDIELYDAVQRLRFEHPEVKVVLLESGKDRVFCAGANIRMLAGASHVHKVNFCKFTNETRNSIEEAGEKSGQHYIAVVSGSCAGGGYELALATDHIILTDDSASSVALPEVPLLAVLPGTGGLTRVTDKRRVRRDRADIFCSIEEGVKGQRAAQWRLVDEAVPNSKLDEVVSERAAQYAAKSDRPDDAEGIVLGPVDRRIERDAIRYSALDVDIDREAGTATLTLKGPDTPAPESVDAMHRQGDGFWPLRLARELDDAILHLRLNETRIGVMVFRSQGDIAGVFGYDNFLDAHAKNWLAREILLYWARVLKRVDLTSRTLVTLVEPGSCFAGTLAEIVFAADRAFIAEGEFEGSQGEASLALHACNFGRYPTVTGISRLESRFYGEPESVDAAREKSGESLDAAAAEALGLVTAAYDEIDWEDEVRIYLEERASFSPDALTGMESNLRCVGPETMESKIFGRLTAWQNWIFQRPNAVGESGALRRYGSGIKGDYNSERV
ncbi:MAG: 2,3-epoxybenzoyl-CoA dihydrolase [Proteobacteria bacterium]|nr:MAG: 2,3-epoxybenzoyl-CoA dihydrolase [Pseudomonadota bacterium]